MRGVPQRAKHCGGRGEKRKSSGPEAPGSRVGGGEGGGPAGPAPASLTSLGRPSGLLLQQQRPHLSGGLPLGGETRNRRARQPGRQLRGPGRLGPGQREQAPGPTSPSVGAPPTAAAAARGGRTPPPPGPHQPPPSRQTPHLWGRQQRRGRGRGLRAPAPPPPPGCTRRSPFVPQAAGTPATNPCNARCAPARRTAPRAPRACSRGRGAHRPRRGRGRRHARLGAHSPHLPPPGPLIRPRCWAPGLLQVRLGPPGPVAPPEHCTSARFPRARARACTRLSPSPSAPRRPPPQQLPPPPPSPLARGAEPARGRPGSRGQGGRATRRLKGAAAGLLAIFAPRSGLGGPELGAAGQRAFIPRLSSAGKKGEARLGCGFPVPARFC